MPDSEEANRDDMGVGSAAHSRRMKDSEFQQRVQEMFEQAEHLEAAVMEAVGAAAKCWNEPPAGYFDNSKARIVALSLIDWINTRMEWKHDQGD